MFQNTPKPTRKYFTNYGIRVKHTPFLKRYGVRCHNSYQPKNNRLWPGDIGRLEQRTINGNGWFQRILEADFRYGRSIIVASGPFWEKANPPGPIP